MAAHIGSMSNHTEQQTNNDTDSVLSNMLTFALSLLENERNELTANNKYRGLFTISDLRVVALANNLVLKNRMPKLEIVNKLITVAQKNVEMLKRKWTSLGLKSITVEELTSTFDEATLKAFGVRTWTESIPLVEISYNVLYNHAKKYGNDLKAGYTHYSRKSGELLSYSLCQMNNLPLEVRTLYQGYMSLPLIKTSTGGVVVCAENNSTNNMSYGSWGHFLQWAQVEVKLAKMWQSIDYNYHGFMQDLVFRMKVKGDGKQVQLTSGNNLKTQVVCYDVDGELILGYALLHVDNYQPTY